MAHPKLTYVRPDKPRYRDRQRGCTHPPEHRRHSDLCRCIEQHLEAICVGHVFPLSSLLILDLLQHLGPLAQRNQHLAGLSAVLRADAAAGLELPDQTQSLSIRVPMLSCETQGQSPCL